MSPSPQEHQQPPNSQDLSLLVDPIDPASIVLADVVEAVKPEDQTDALSAYEASGLNAPVEPDYSKIGITRPNRSNAKE